MKLENKIVLISGANRGIGRCLVEALLSYPVKKIYAGSRDKNKVPNFNDDRVVPVQLDITDSANIKNAAKLCNDLNLLINNAGVLTYTGILSDDASQLKRDMDTNYYGTIEMTRIFAPLIENNGGGAIANIISILGLASLRSAASYSASKAALFSATQAMRGDLKKKNIEVYAIFPGPIDTELINQIPNIAKASPKTTAENIIKGIVTGSEDIFPDPMAEHASQLWLKNPKALEVQIGKI